MFDTIGSQAINRLVQFRAKPGSDLLSAIEEAAKVEGVRAGVIVSGLGALTKAVFRNLKRFPKSFPVTPDDRVYVEKEQPMELVSLTGWIASGQDGAIEVHSHFAASTVENGTITTLGGHLTKGTMCGIKVVVAIVALPDQSVFAGLDPTTRTPDIYCA